MSISSQDYFDPFLKVINVLFLSYYENIYSKIYDHLTMWQPSLQLIQHTKQAAVLFIDKMKYFQALLIY